MPATGFHLSVVPLRRSSGKSAVAKAAYITREKLKDERTGLPYDFTKRGGIEAVLHAQLKDAPEWSRDIGQAWNAVEAVESRKNSQTAKMIDGLAFPHGIDAEARKRMLTDFMREQFGRKGFIWTASIHTPDKDGDERNYHAHVMWNERPLTAEGFAKTKDREATSFDTRKDALAVMRERWAALSAKQLERAGLPLEAERWRQGHLTLEKQAELARARGDIEFAEECANREPTKHLGRAAVALERKGIHTERGDAHEAILDRNEARQELRQQSAAVAREESRLAAKDERATEYQQRQAAATEQRRATQAARLGGLEDVQTLRGLWQSADSAAAFLTASQAQGFTVARVTAQDARDSREDAKATAGRDPSRSAPVYSKAELVAYNAQGFGFRLDGATLDDAKATERMEQAAGMKLPSLNEARQAVIDAQPDRQAEPAPQPKRNMASLARAAFSGLVEFLFGWLGDRKAQHRPPAQEPSRNLAAEAREASKRADKSLAGAQDIAANYGHRLLQLDPEIQDALRRHRETKQRERERERDDDEGGRER